MRSPATASAWIPRVAWAAAVAWFLVILALFQMEPLGLVPTSAGRIASLDQVRAARARADLLDLAREVGRYAASTGTYPATLELLGRWERRAIRQLQDPWGQPYQVRYGGSGLLTSSPGEVSLISAGPDRRLETPDDIVIPGG
jgi:hypothetical protein